MMIPAGAIAPPLSCVRSVSLRTMRQQMMPAVSTMNDSTGAASASTFVRDRTVQRSRAAKRSTSSEVPETMMRSWFVTTVSASA